MPAEKFVHDFVKEAGYNPIPDRAIVVTYAPADLSEKIARFFSNEFFALQMCENSLVLLPFGRMRKHGRNMFWAKGYHVTTVEGNKTKTQVYPREEEQGRLRTQMSFKEYGDSFKNAANFDDASPEAPADSERHK